VDTQAPVISAVLHDVGHNLDGTNTTGSISSMRLTASESTSGSGLSSWRYSLDNGSTWTTVSSYSTMANLVLPGIDGWKTIKVTISDNAGLRSSPFIVSVLKDSTAPVATDFSAAQNANGTLHSNSTHLPRLYWNITDAGVGCANVSVYVNGVKEWSRNGAGCHSTSPIQSSNLQTGNNNIRLEFVDWLGNSDGVDITLQVDYEIPQCTFSLSPTYTTWTNLTEYTINVSCVHSMSNQIYYVLSSLDANSTFSLYPVENGDNISLPSGDYDVHLRAVSPGGHQNHSSVHVMIDILGPVVGNITMSNGVGSGIPLEGGIVGPNRMPTISGSLTDDLSGAHSWRYSLDGGTTWLVTASNGSSFTITTLPPGDGMKTIVFQANDTAGNWGPLSWVNFTYDSTPSELVRFDIGQQNPWISPQLPGFHLRAVDSVGCEGGHITFLDVSGTLQSITEGNFCDTNGIPTLPPSFPTSLLAGDHTFTWHVVDLAGNTNSTSLVVPFDLHAADCTLGVEQAPTQHGWYYQSNFTMDISCTNATYPSQLTHFLLWDANNISVTDSSIIGLEARRGLTLELVTYTWGGHASSVSFTMDIDRTPPEPTTLLSVDGMDLGLYFSDIVAFSGNSEDLLSGVCFVEVSYDGSDWAVPDSIGSFGSSVDFEHEFTELSGEGNRSFAVRSTDCAGNYRVDYYDIILDNQGPTLDSVMFVDLIDENGGILPAYDGLRDEFNVSFTFATEGAECATVEITINSRPMGSYDCNYVTALDISGIDFTNGLSIRFVARDVLGNVVTEDFGPYDADYRAPWACRIDHGLDEFSNVSSLNVSVDANHMWRGLIEYRLYLNNQDQGGILSGGTLSNYSRGWNTIGVTATSVGGFESMCEAEQFFFDDQPPIASLMYGGISLDYQSFSIYRIDVQIHATDVGSGLHKYRVYDEVHGWHDLLPWIDTNSSVQNISLHLAGDLGFNNLKVQITDAAGNSYTQYVTVVRNQDAYLDEVCYPALDGAYLTKNDISREDYRFYCDVLTSSPINHSIAILSGPGGYSEEKELVNGGEGYFSLYPDVYNIVNDLDGTGDFNFGDWSLTYNFRNEEGWSAEGVFMFTLHPEEGDFSCIFNSPDEVFCDYVVPWLKFTNASVTIRAGDWEVNGTDSTNWLSLNGSTGVRISLLALREVYPQLPDSGVYVFNVSLIDGVGTVMDFNDSSVDITVNDLVETSSTSSLLRFIPWIVVVGLVLCLFLPANSPLSLRRLRLRFDREGDNEFDY
jgi:hypothetical protein